MTAHFEKIIVEQGETAEQETAEQLKARRKAEKARRKAEKVAAKKGRSCF